MALIDELSDALKEAMKAKDKPKLDAIRQVQTEIAKKKSSVLETSTKITKLDKVRKNDLGNFFSTFQGFLVAK